MAIDQARATKKRKSGVPPRIAGQVARTYESSGSSETGTDSRRRKDRGTVRRRHPGAATEPWRAADRAARRTASRRLGTGLYPATSRRRRRPRPPRASLSRPQPAAHRPPPAARNPPSFSARAAATTRVITRCSAPRRPAAALQGPPPRPAAGSSPAPEDVETAAVAAAPPPARFPILAGRGPPSSRSGATLLGEATAAAREPWSGLWPRCWRRERLWAQGSGSRRGSGSVRAWERECQSQPRHRHRLRRAGTQRPRVRHGGRPYWKRARAAGPGAGL